MKHSPVRDQCTAHWVAGEDSLMVALMWTHSVRVFGLGKKAYDTNRRPEGGISFM